jgi:hypothetical protein
MPFAINGGEWFDLTILMNFGSFVQNFMAYQSCV